eukprot:scaffold306985_cov14-Tisochrysis_lutea.AAC.1
MARKKFHEKLAQQREEAAKQGSNERHRGSSSSSSSSSARDRTGKKRVTRACLGASKCMECENIFVKCKCAFFTD